MAVVFSGGPNRHSGFAFLPGPYSNGGTIAVDPALTESVGTRGALAFISNVNVGGGLFEITGTKTGCKLVGFSFPVPISSS